MHTSRSATLTLTLLSITFLAAQGCSTGPSSNEGELMVSEVPCVYPVNGLGDTFACNRDHPDYRCPATLAEISAQPNFCEYGDDTGSFEHRGRCFRQILAGPGGPSQQCCYGDDGRDNGSGSVDMWGGCMDNWPGPGQQCSYNPVTGGTCLCEHVRQDVLPLCCALADMGNQDFDSCMPFKSIACHSVSRSDCPSRCNNPLISQAWKNRNCNKKKLPVPVETVF
jgi:hypothetical protein